MSRAFLAVFAILFWNNLTFAASDSIQATVHEKTPWDFSFALGTAFGKLQQDESSVDGAETPGLSTTFQGVLASVMLNRDLNSDFTFSGGVVGVINERQGHLSRLGAEAGMAYHLLGASFQGEAGRTPYQVSLTTKLGLQRYNLADSFSETKIEGATVENAWGLQGRLAVSDSGALQLDITQSVLALSLGTPRVHAWPTEVKISYRALF